MAKHRAPGIPSLSSYDVDFAPAHCAGTSCLHAHPGEPQWPAFPGLDEPLEHCDRKGPHKAHDITNERGDFRCPGQTSMGRLPKGVVVKRVLQARQAIGGAR